MCAVLLVCDATCCECYCCVLVFKFERVNVIQVVQLLNVMLVCCETRSSAALRGLQRPRRRD